jgi:hypothetical protein
MEEWNLENGAGKSYSTSLSEGTRSHCDRQYHMMGEYLWIGFAPDF